jgi:hypothetical protein
VRTRPGDAVFEIGLAIIVAIIAGKVLGWGGPVTMLILFMLAGVINSKFDRRI